MFLLILLLLRLHFPGSFSPHGTQVQSLAPSCLQGAVKPVTHLAGTERHNVTTPDVLDWQPTRTGAEDHWTRPWEPTRVMTYHHSCPVAHGFRLTSCLEADSTSISIYTWLVGCDATFFPSCLTELGFLTRVFPACVLLSRFCKDHGERFCGFS